MYQTLLITHVSIRFGGGLDKSNFSKSTIRAEPHNGKNLWNPTQWSHINMILVSSASIPTFNCSVSSSNLKVLIGTPSHSHLYWVEPLADDCLGQSPTY